MEYGSRQDDNHDAIADVARSYDDVIPSPSPG